MHKLVPESEIKPRQKFKRNNLGALEEGFISVKGFDEGCGNLVAK